MNHFSGCFQDFFLFVFRDYDVFLVWTSLCLSCLRFSQLLGSIGLFPSPNLSFQPVCL